MDKENAKLFLLKCSQVADEIEEADLLVETLGCLPLAIEQAGGFIRETGDSIAEYRELYKVNRTKALKEGLSAANKRPYYRKTESRYMGSRIKSCPKKRIPVSSVEGQKVGVVSWTSGAQSNWQGISEMNLIRDYLASPQSKACYLER